MSATVVAFPRQNRSQPPSGATLIRSRRDETRAELVAALLLELERRPLAPCLCYPGIDVGGHPFVIVTIGDIAFRVLPEDCRTAADTLIAEQAFTGCVGVAGDLNEAASIAEFKARPSLRLPRRRYVPAGTGGKVIAALSLIIAVCVVAFGGR